MGGGGGPERGHVYVTNVGSDTVSVIDTATNKEVARIPVGSGPVGVAVAPGGGHVYVANTTEVTQGSPGANTVSVIDTASRKVVTTLPPAGKNRITGRFLIGLREPSHGLASGERLLAGRPPGTVGSWTYG